MPVCTSKIRHEPEEHFAFCDPDESPSPFCRGICERFAECQAQDRACRYRRNIRRVDGLPVEATLKAPPGYVSHMKLYYRTGAEKFGGFYTETDMQTLSGSDSGQYWGLIPGSAINSGEDLEYFIVAEESAESLQAFRKISPNPSFIRAPDFGLTSSQNRTILKNVNPPKKRSSEDGVKDFSPGVVLTIPSLY